ncbi:hypothetical protein [Isoptericola dokdonensis]|jgi:hypothetical protein|uniref:Uncharacterized protein n=1 Tax=Isoptericola dokdonensis DS-3 TaxID=1300344 RepID=A0A168FD36_9MICO|nr:hypothetical protein [Isoptericola dokdonensis]ANC31401.1 hypothetical protein I598_1853 [Isoptericola dokdonensis DS-3]
MDDVGRDAGHDETGRERDSAASAPTDAERHGLPSVSADEVVDARLAQFSGVVGEVDDPLTWGLDLEDEALTGDEGRVDPTSDRFVRSYRTFAGEAFEVETLRTEVPDDLVEDVVRAACSGALAAPLHADIAAPVETDGDAAVPDFADGFADYRSAMRAIVAEVDAVPLESGELRVDGEPCRATRVQVRDVVAVHAPARGRAIVVTGPGDLVDQVDIVTRPIRSLLHPPPR